MIMTKMIMIIIVHHTVTKMNMVHHPSLISVIKKDKDNTNYNDVVEIFCIAEDDTFKQITNMMGT